MANDFTLWVDDSDVSTRCVGLSDFKTGSRRFASGEALSAKWTNTALRQANLVAVALMKALAPNANISFTSSLSDIQNAILGGVATTTKNGFMSSSDKTTLNSLSTTVEQILNGQSTVAKSHDVDNKINGKNISDIFESNGTTVKNATNAVNATNSENATNATNTSFTNDSYQSASMASLVLPQGTYHIIIDDLDFGITLVDGTIKRKSVIVAGSAQGGCIKYEWALTVTSGRKLELYLITYIMTSPSGMSFTFGADTSAHTVKYKLIK